MGGVACGSDVAIASSWARASVVGLAAAYGAGLQDRVAQKRLNAVMRKGLKSVAPAVAILLCAWMLGSINGPGLPTVIADQFHAASTAGTSALDHSCRPHLALPIGCRAADGKEGSRSKHRGCDLGITI